MRGTNTGLSTRKKIAYTVSLGIILFVICDTVVRIVAHVLAEPFTPLFENDPVLGIRHVANASSTVASKGTAPHRVSFNNLGHRGTRDVGIEPVPGSVRVVVLGGSTTESIYVADGKTWPEYLERRLRNATGREETEVLNLAVSGYTTANSVRNYEINGARLRPDIVVVYHGVNDFTFHLVLSRQASLIRRTIPEGHETHMWELTGLRSGEKPIEWASFVDGLRIIGDTFEQFAKERGILFVDVETSVGKDKSLFIDHVHYTEKGTRAVADVFAESLLAFDILSAAPGKGEQGRTTAGE